VQPLHGAVHKAVAACSAAGVHWKAANPIIAYELQGLKLSLGQWHS